MSQIRAHDDHLRPGLFEAENRALAGAEPHGPPPQQASDQLHQLQQLQQHGQHGQHGQQQQPPLPPPAPPQQLHGEPQQPLQRQYPPNHPLGNSKHLCSICGDRATGKHYGVYSCEGCKGFFKRTIRKDIVYVCRAQGACLIDMRQRNRCQCCRYQKCLERGMKREAVQEEKQRLKMRAAAAAASASFGAPHSLASSRQQHAEAARNLPEAIANYNDPTDHNNNNHNHNHNHNNNHNNNHLHHHHQQQHDQLHGHHCHHCHHSSGAARANGRSSATLSSGTGAGHCDTSDRRPGPELARAESTTGAGMFGAPQLAPQLQQQQQQLQLERGLHQQAPAAAMIELQPRQQQRHNLLLPQHHHHGQLETAPRIDQLTLKWAAQVQIERLLDWARSVPKFGELLLDDQVTLLRACWNELIIADIAFSSAECLKEAANLRGGAAAAAPSWLCSSPSPSPSLSPSPSSPLLQPDERAAQTSGGRSPATGSLCIGRGLFLDQRQAHEIGLGNMFARILRELVWKLADMRVDANELACLRAIVLLNPETQGLKTSQPIEELRADIYTTLELYCRDRRQTEPNRFGKLLLRLPVLRSIGLKCCEPARAQQQAEVAAGLTSLQADSQPFGGLASPASSASSANSNCGSLQSAASPASGSQLVSTTTGALASPAASNTSGPAAAAAAYPAKLLFFGLCHESASVEAFLRSSLSGR